MTLKEGRAVEDVMPLFSSGTLGTCTFNSYGEATIKVTVYVGGTRTGGGGY